MRDIQRIWTSQDYKRCCRCRQFKSLSEYSASKSRKDGLQPRCKACHAELNRSSKAKLTSDKREELNAKRRLWRQTTAGKIATQRELSKRGSEWKMYRKLWRSREENQKKHREYVKGRRQNDVMYRIAGNLRSRVRALVKKLLNFKGGNHVITSLGCSLPELKTYLESQFNDGMNWNNYGPKGWHIDHKVPLLSASTVEALYALNHYTNLQPLWVKDHIEKTILDCRSIRQE